MPKFKNYSDTLVERQIKAIIRRNPDAINPKDGLDCLYHKGRGANIKRCLVGQWGYEQGFKTPKPINGGAREVVEDLWSDQAAFTEAAIDVLAAYQQAADGSYEGHEPVPWGEVLSALA